MIKIPRVCKEWTLEILRISCKCVSLGKSIFNVIDIKFELEIVPVILRFGDPQTQEYYEFVMESEASNLFLSRNIHLQRNGRRFEEGKNFFSVFGNGDVNSLNMTAVNRDMLQD